ncbi:hypothetical protein QQP08_021726 [Theobroma cacao]|nr:hypothetical protein QQP08_021726 [Theobroma cacao]
MSFSHIAKLTFYQQFGSSKIGPSSLQHRVLTIRIWQTIHQCTRMVIDILLGEVTRMLMRRQQPTFPMSDNVCVESVDSLN